MQTRPDTGCHGYRWNRRTRLLQSQAAPPFRKLLAMADSREVQCQRKSSACSSRSDSVPSRPMTCDLIDLDLVEDGNEWFGGIAMSMGRRGRLQPLRMHR